MDEDIALTIKSQLETLSGEKNLDRILTVDEVAEYLKLGKSTVYKLLKQGKIPARKVGGGWRFSKLRIDEWMENSLS